MMTREPKTCGEEENNSECSIEYQQHYNENGREDGVKHRNEENQSGYQSECQEDVYQTDHAGEKPDDVEHEAGEEEMNQSE